MQLLFVDESGTAPAPSKVHENPVFVLGGVIIPEHSWTKLKRALDDIKKKFNIEGEIKWRHFSKNSKGPLTHLSAENLNEVRETLLKLLSSNRSIKTISVIVDTEATYKNRRDIKNSDDLYHDAFKKLSERFQYYLQDISREAGLSINGLIIADHRNNGDDNRLKEFHYQLLENSGYNVSTYSHLIEGLFMAASHHSPGTQFADLVAGAVYRAVARKDERFLEIIRSTIRTSPSKNVDGWGLVYIPKNTDLKL